MHPILMDIFARPVGWLAIGGSLVMVGLGLALFLFVRRKIREEERGGS
jgi:protein-S-isoprenylcysteine O-methyltransferase Ste14